MRKTVAILSFSPIARDARVLRQIEHLVPHYDLMVLGFGPPHSRWQDDPRVKWVTVPQPPPTHFRTPVRLVVSGALMLLGRLHPSFWDIWYWRSHANQFAYQSALAGASAQLAAVHANDWYMLPLAARLAQFCGARLVLDLHEYAPLEWEEQLLWRITYPAAIRSFLMRFAPQIDASVTVGYAIADRYRAEFPLDPIVVLNAPDATELPRLTEGGDRVRMIHHGGAIRSRRLELMIETLAHCDARFTLDFMLVGDAAYIAALQNLAAARVPGRVTFHAPVPPEQIVERIAQYQLGLCLIYPTSYNYLMSLPNKLFDFLGAGLAVCVGPSPEMGRLVREHGCGVVTSSFAPEDVAVALNQIDSQSLVAMRRAARRASETLNAANEMAKLTALYERLIGA